MPIWEIRVRRASVGGWVGGWMGAGVSAYLLHDSGFSLREGDVASRLVLDEFDLDLPPLAAGLGVLVVVVVVASGGPRALARTVGGGSGNGGL